MSSDTKTATKAYFTGHGYAEFPNHYYRKTGPEM